MQKSITEQFTAIVSELPDYCMHYFISKNDQFQPKTKLAYAWDLKTFIGYLESTGFGYELSDLNRLTPLDIETYLMFLDKYQITDPITGKVKICTNSPSGKKRKLSTLKSLFKYLLKNGKITKDPTALVDTPKIREKEILVLSDEETDKIKSSIYTGHGLSDRQMKWHEKTAYRDMAIISLFLGTGIRVSELVGINLHDIDLEEQRVLITRKGGKQSFVYFKSDVAKDIEDYISFERTLLLKDDSANNEDEPLFVTQQKTRITVQWVRKIIKRYASFVLPPNVKISPHTLRKTYGTKLYLKYKDLSLVQHALGHSSPSTTAKYYAKFDERLLKITKEE